MGAGAADFWDAHGIGFICVMFFFPRVMLLFSGLWSGGALWWVGWMVTPRLLVAGIATLKYWDSNPLLVALAWVWALFLEAGEKLGISLLKRREG